MFGRGHAYDDLAASVIQKTLSSKRTIVEDGRWIGICARILAGGRVGQNTVVRVGAVVSTNVPPWTGVPVSLVNVIEKQEQAAP